MANTRFMWCVKEHDTGLPCASGNAPTKEDARREMMRYAIQYGQDGPVRYFMWEGRTQILSGQIGSVLVERAHGCGHMQGRGAA